MANLPTWQNILSTPIDDYSGSFVWENVSTQTLLNVSQYLTATISNSTTSPVQYFLSNDGPFLLLNSDGAFIVRSSSTNPTFMPVAVGHPLDASDISRYILRLRAFVSSHTFMYWTFMFVIHNERLTKLRHMLLC